MSVIVNTNVSGGATGTDGSSVGGGYESLTQAAFDILVAANSLSVGTQYYLTDVPARYVAKTTSTYDGVGFVSGTTYIFGATAFATQTEIDLAAGTWATRPVSGFDADVMYFRRMTDIGNMPGGTVMSWLGGTSTAWALTAPLRLRLKGAGTTTTSPQYPTNTRHAFPAAFLAGCSRFDVNLKFEQSDETSTLTSWRIKLGTAGTASDATILAPTGTPMAAGDNQRGYPTSFNIETASTIRSDSISNAAAVGWQTSAVNSVTDAVVSLTAGDDTSDALYLGVDYTMGVSNTALSTTLIVTLYP